MAQFDVYRNPRRGSAAPYLLDVQHNMLAHLATRVVVPLIPAAGIKPMTRLNPVFEVAGKKVVMSTTELAGIAVKDIGEKIVSLESQRVTIVSALEYVFTGI